MKWNRSIITITLLVKKSVNDFTTSNVSILSDWLLIAEFVPQRSEGEVIIERAYNNVYSLATGRVRIFMNV